MKKQPKPIHGWSMVKGGVLDGFCFATRRDAERYVASRWTWSWASGDSLIETRLAPAKKAKRGGKCKHVLKEMDALCKAKNELIDERDKLMRQIDKLIAASVKVTNTMPLSCGSGERELDHYDACGDLDQAFMAVVMDRAAESDARCMAKYYSLGRKQEMECQMPSGHVGMHSMAWDGKTCQWTNGGAR